MSLTEAYSLAACPYLELPVHQAEHLNVKKKDAVIPEKIIRIQRAQEDEILKMNLMRLKSFVLLENEVSIPGMPINDLMNIHGHI